MKISKDSIDQRPQHGAIIPAIVFSCCFLAIGNNATAASFNISTASTSAQTLGAGESGTITSTGSLTLGGSTVPVLVTGSSTLTNSGQIIQNGNARAISNETGTVTWGITNNAGAVIQTANGDAVRVTQSGSSVTLDNYGTITSLNGAKAGSQAVDWNSITTGANTLTNYSAGIIQASNADAVRPGTSGTIYNYGIIRSTVTTDTGSDGIDVQNRNSVTVNNYATGLVEGARHGITGGPSGNTAFITSISNTGGTIQGDNGSGINLDGFSASQSATIVNSGTITGNGHNIGDGLSHDGDGIDVDGVVNVTNTGTIRSINAFSPTVGTPAQSEGISVGGGTITNSGTIEGLVAAGNTNAVGRGISLLGNDITTGPNTGSREPIYANAIVTNQAGGLIRGDSDSGIAVEGYQASGFTVTINNNAGATIQGGGSTNAAIRTGLDNDTVTNAGTINGSSSGKAVDLGGGNNTFTVQGGAAAIQGSVSGGVGGSNTLNLNIGAGNSFNFGYTFSNFANVNVNSGTTTLSGASTYSGPTTINGGSLLVANGSGSATGSSAVEVKSGGLFGGTGSITGTVTVDAGGNLAPGAGGVGTLAVGNTLLNAGSTLSVDLDPANSLADLLNVSGSVALGNANLFINLLSAPTLGQTFDILFNDGSDSISGLFNQGNSISAHFGGHTYFFAIDYAYNGDGGVVGNDIRLTETGVPEPGTAFLFGLGGMLLAWKKRFNKA